MNGVDEDLQGWSMDLMAVVGRCRKNVSSREASAETSLWAFLRPPFASYTASRHAFVLDDGNFSIATRNMTVEE